MPKFPDWIQPMAATLTQERFTGPEWIFERKFDGIRLLAYKRGAKVELFSRNRLPQNIPALARAIAQLPHRELILGPVVSISSPSGRGWVRVRSLAGGPVVSISSPSGRGRVRVRSLAGGPVVSISSPSGRGRVRVRSLATGSTANLASDSAPADFVFAGKIGTGFDTKMLLDLRAQLDHLEIPKPPFTKAVGLPRLRAHWVRPEIVVQVGFIQWTVHGKLRHPRLLAIRHDKSAVEVVRE